MITPDELMDMAKGAAHAFLAVSLAGDLDNLDEGEDDMLTTGIIAGHVGTIFALQSAGMLVLPDIEDDEPEPDCG